MRVQQRPVRRLRLRQASCRAVLVSPCMRHTPRISRVPNNTEISPEEKLKTNAVKKDYSISNGKKSIQCYFLFLELIKSIAHQEHKSILRYEIRHIKCISHEP